MNDDIETDEQWSEYLSELEIRLRDAEEVIRGYQWLATEMQNRNAANVTELCQRLRDEAEGREGLASAAFLEVDQLRAENERLRRIEEAARSVDANPTDFPTLMVLRDALAEEKE
jgi:hypothetical protein